MLGLGGVGLVVLGSGGQIAQAGVGDLLALVAVVSAGMLIWPTLRGGVGAGAVAGAAACGWVPPYPPVGPLVRRRLWAEAVTDRLASAAFRVLDSAEGAELLGLLGAARQRARGG